MYLSHLALFAGGRSCLWGRCLAEVEPIRGEEGGEEEGEEGSIERIVWSMRVFDSAFSIVRPGGCREWEWECRDEGVGAGKSLDPTKSNPQDV